MPGLRLYCPTCDRHYSPEIFSCPHAASGQDHALRREWQEPPSPEAVLRAWDSGEQRTFAIFAPWLASWQIMGAANYTAVLQRIEQCLQEQEGKNFAVTPVMRCDALATAMGRTGALFCKDETGNVTGSHKGRHLMATLLHLEALRHNKGEAKPRLAIYSCGNAALAAAAVARSGGYQLETFVPADVAPSVIAMLEERGALVSPQSRSATGQGDPCYLAFAAALQNGAAPFSCSGADTWSNIEGGMTLGWELALQLRDKQTQVQHVVLHIGGGALARAMVLALREAKSMGLLPALPIFHAVQTPGAFPFVRAWFISLEHCCRALGHPLDFSYDRKASPNAEISRLHAYLAVSHQTLQQAALLVKNHFHTPGVQKALHETATEKQRFMWPWDATGAPHSLAEGILDDETYDWRDVMLGVLETGGIACVATETQVAAANALCQQHTSMSPSHTGSAALAGLLHLTESGIIPEGDAVALPVTGILRPE